MGLRNSTPLPIVCSQCFGAAGENKHQPTYLLIDVARQPYRSRPVRRELIHVQVFCSRANPFPGMRRLSSLAVTLRKYPWPYLAASHSSRRGGPTIPFAAGRARVLQQGLSGHQWRRYNNTAFNKERGKRARKHRLWEIRGSDPQPDKKSGRRLGCLPLRGNILIVGDGDFTFSAAVAKKNRSWGNNATITASSLDTKGIVSTRYAKGKKNLDRLNADDAVTVRHGIDATKIGLSAAGLGGGRRRRRWDSIVWNFPYPAGAGSAGTHSAAVCSQLLSDFFASAKTCLKPAGRVYVTTLNRQQAVGLPITPDWNIETMALEAGLELEDVLPFNRKEYPGYLPKRSFEDTSFPHEHAKTRVFCHGRQDAGESSPTLESRAEVSRSAILAQSIKVEQAFHKEIQKLLHKQAPKKEIYVGVFRDLYKQEFNKPLPYDGIERLGATLKRAAAAGVCGLETRQDSALWIVDAKKGADEQQPTINPMLDALRTSTIALFCRPRVVVGGVNAGNRCQQQGCV